MPKLTPEQRKEILDANELVNVATMNQRIVSAPKIPREESPRFPRPKYRRAVK